jgi:hypothetical protein
MSISIRQIPVKGNTDYIALEKVCDDMRDAHKAALRALENARRTLDDPSTYPPSAPPLNMDEIRVRHWLRDKHGPVTAAHVASTLFGNRLPSKSLSMSVAKCLKAAGWQRLKRVRGTQYWARVS